MIEIGYASIDEEKFKKERENATPVYLLTKTGCG